MFPQHTPTTHPAPFLVHQLFECLLNSLQLGLTHRQIDMEKLMDVDGCWLKSCTTAGCKQTWFRPSNSYPLESLTEGVLEVVRAPAMNPLLTSQDVIPISYENMGGCRATSYLSQLLPVSVLSSQQTNLRFML